MTDSDQDDHTTLNTSTELAKGPTLYCKRCNAKLVSLLSTDKAVSISKLYFEKIVSHIKQTSSPQVLLLPQVTLARWSVQHSPKRSLLKSHNCQVISCHLF